MKRILNSCEKTAYWWIITIRTKLDEIYRNPKYFGKDEEAFKKLFENYSEKDWRFLYERICDYIKDQTTLSQSTAKKGHQVINEILGSPDISLSPRQSKPTVLDMYPNNVYATCKSKDKIPSSYDDSFDYVLGANEEELEFYNLVLSIIIVIREKNREFNSLEILRNNFCTAYLNTDDLNTITRKFDMVIAVLERYSIIKTNKDVIVEWPKEIDGHNLEKYLGEARYYSEGVLREYEMGKTEKEYQSPIHREDRRTTYAQISSVERYNNKIVQRVLKELDSTNAILEKWNTTWFEQLSGAYSKTLSEKGVKRYLVPMQNSFFGRYQLVGAHGATKTLPPLRTVILEYGEEQHICEFGIIRLLGIRYGKDKMNIDFYNNGLITLSKQNLSGINEYAVSVNVAKKTPNFDIVLGNNQFVISLNKGIITEKSGDLEITRDINSGSGIVKIKEYYGNVLVIYEAEDSKEGNLLYTTLEIVISSENAELEATHYRITVDEFKGIKKIFDVDYSILASIFNRITRTDDVHATICQLEDNIIDLLKNIRDEAPIVGLVERINKCLSYANVDEGQRHYKKEAANN